MEKTEKFHTCRYSKKTPTNIYAVPMRCVNNNEELSVVASGKILGVLIDNNLTQTNHTDAVQRKLFLIFGCCPELRNTCLLSKEFNVQPHINYCNVIWGGTSQRNADRILWLQKKELVKLF